MYILLIHVNLFAVITAESWKQIIFGKVSACAYNVCVKERLSTSATLTNKVIFLMSPNAVIWTLFKAFMESLSDLLNGHNERSERNTCMTNRLDQITQSHKRIDIKFTLSV